MICSCFLDFHPMPHSDLFFVIPTKVLLMVLLLPGAVVEVVGVAGVAEAVASPSSAWCSLLG